MAHINHRRQKLPKQLRKPVPMKPSRAIDPQTLYNRKKEKEQLRNIVKEYCVRWDKRWV